MPSLFKYFTVILLEVPSSLVASMIGVKGQEFFTATEEETKSVNASDYLK